MFEIGQLIICVNDQKNPKYTWTHPKPDCFVVKNQIYEIREIIIDPPPPCRYDVGLRLVEIVRPDGDCPFNATRFRPLKPTNIDIFTKMLKVMSSDMVEW